MNLARLFGIILTLASEDNHGKALIRVCCFAVRILRKDDFLITVVVLTLCNFGIFRDLKWKHQR